MTSDAEFKGGAMLRGAFARRSGDVLTDNPYPDFPGYMIQRRAWAHGWDNSDDVIDEANRKARLRLLARRNGAA